MYKPNDPRAKDSADPGHKLLGALEQMSIKKPERARRRTESIMTPEDARRAISEVRESRRLAAKRRRPPGIKKLQRYEQEIAALRQEGASQNDIVVWLRREHKLRVHQSTVHRFLRATNHDATE